MTDADTNNSDPGSMEPNGSIPVACFSVLTEADPSAVPRVLEKALLIPSPLLSTMPSIALLVSEFTLCR